MLTLKQFLKSSLLFRPQNNLKSLYYMLEQNSQTSLTKQCLRFNQFNPSKITHQRIIAYEELRDKGCPRLAALKFAAKNQCKHDTTIIKSGPVNYRVLNATYNKFYSLKGWSHEDLAGIVDKEHYEQGLKKELQLQKQLDVQSSKLKAKEDQRIASMQILKNEQEQRFGLMQIKQLNERIRKIQKIQEENRLKEEGLHVFELQNQKFLELAEELFKKRIGKVANMNTQNKHSILNSEQFFSDILDNQQLSKVRLQNYKDVEYQNPNKSLTILSFSSKDDHQQVNILKRALKNTVLSIINKSQKDDDDSSNGSIKVIKENESDTQHEELELQSPDIQQAAQLIKLVKRGSMLPQNPSRNFQDIEKRVIDHFHSQTIETSSTTNTMANYIQIEKLKLEKQIYYNKFYDRVYKRISHVGHPIKGSYYRGSMTERLKSDSERFKSDSSLKGSTKNISYFFQNLSQIPTKKQKKIILQKHQESTLPHIFRNASSIAIAKENSFKMPL